MTVPAPDLATLVSRALPRRGSAVLAVSGGLDSMALLDVAASARRRRACSIVVATYDHASGAHSARAAAFVVRKALAYGIPVVTERAGRAELTEAAWRAARWNFLHAVAGTTKAVILTAHTRDDQIETVLMRALRGAGARGLAGLRAPSVIRRPFVDVSREELRAYAMARSLTWIEDPTNRSPRHLRNRIRHDLLPSLLRSRPMLAGELRNIGDRAATWRCEVSAMVDAAVRFEVGRDLRGTSTLDVTAADVTQYSRPVLAIIWPELAARAGVTLDRRGTDRIAEFTISGKVGSRIQLSGGWELLRSRKLFELRASMPGEQGDQEIRSLETPMTWDRWVFSSGKKRPATDPWRASLPGDDSLWIRAWQPGDKLTIRHGDRLVTRKVKYFLSDAGISGHIRARWPVVLAGDEIVWIPGVRRSDAATVRPGRPVVTYVCDYLDRRS